MAADAEAWSPSSWRDRPIVQQPKYADQDELRSAVAKLRALPPLVACSEVESLLRHLGDCAQGRSFLLQGGDCAERFSDCTEQHIVSQMRIIVQMSLVLLHSTNTPIVRVGRLAGQYAKPRSSDTEVVEGYGEIPSFRGDNVSECDSHLVQRLLRRVRRRCLAHTKTVSLSRANSEGNYALWRCCWW